MTRASARALPPNGRPAPPGDERVRSLLVGAYVLGLGVSITLAETALVLLALRTLWRAAHGRVRRWPLAAPILAFVLATLMAAVRSERPLESLASSRTVCLVLALWVMIDALPTLAAARGALVGLLGVLGVVSVLGIGQTAFCTEPWFVAAGDRAASWWPALGRFFVKCYRAHAFYSIYMTFGGVLDVVLLAALPGLLVARALPPWAPLAWLVSLVAFALTYVRGAWLGFAAGALALAASARRHRVTLVAGLGVLALALLLVPGVRRRALSIADPSDPTSWERRLMWRSGLAMALDHPITGVGPGQVKHVYPRYAAAGVPNKQRGHLHNTPIQILVERGVVGLAAWLWLFAAFLARAVRLVRRLEAPGPRALAAGATAAVIGFLVAGLFEHNFGDSEVLLVALTMMAVVLVQEDETVVA